VEFNPWRLALRIDALKVAEPGGETLVAARSFYINVALWHSAWLRGASLDELDLLEPYINRPPCAKDRLAEPAAAGTHRLPIES